MATAAGTWYTTSTPTILRLLSGQALGSTSLATDASGAEVTGSRTLYYPYGGVRWPTGGSTLPTNFTYTGQRNEAGIGLMDYHARFYDAALGRFISADTIVPNAANPQDLNRYAYVRNSPLNYRDPSGHAAVSGGGISPLTELIEEQYETGGWDDHWTIGEFSHAVRSGLGSAANE
ncbi:MAG: RHS repeat-associated core domain-containing protein, partial [Chloroflexota bacterium]|nr:RHS repeat-associated core domain-containing protein [Chloroflexota bacterium]